MENEVQTKSGKVWLGEDGIIRKDTHPNAEIELSEAQDTIRAVTKITGKNKIPMLVYLQDVKSVSLDARQHFTTEMEKTNVSAVALLVGSAVSRILGNFFLRVNKPRIPVSIFSVEAEAIKWLKRHQKVKT